jgi:ribosomal-protein-alanine N-acetyltransferase
MRARIWTSLRALPWTSRRGNCIFSWVTSERAPAYLHQATRVALRRITHHDQEEFTGLAKVSAEFHRPWIYMPTTATEFYAYLARFDHGAAEGLLVCICETGAIAGFINITEIVRSSYQRGTLGYGVFTSAAGQGYMSEGFELVFRLAFHDLKLHRLEADIQPGNSGSLNLVRRLGFRNEGYSPGLVLIKGVWRDHERWAITSDIIKTMH